MVGTPKIEPDSPNSAHEKELSVDAKLQRQALAISRAERESILGLLPNYIKENFGNIGYGKFEGEWFPVVLVSPFNFPASAPIRKTWQKHFDECLEEDTEFQHLAWWIGAATLSLVRPKQFIPFEEATELHAERIDKIDKYLYPGKKPEKGSRDEYLLEALRDMDKLRKLTPQQRLAEIFPGKLTQDFDLSSFVMTLDKLKKMTAQPISNDSNRVPAPPERVFSSHHRRTSIQASQKLANPVHTFAAPQRRTSIATSQPFTAPERLLTSIKRTSSIGSSQKPTASQSGLEKLQRRKSMELIRQHAIPVKALEALHYDETVKSNRKLVAPVSESTAPKRQTSTGENPLPVPPPAKRCKSLPVPPSAKKGMLAMGSPMVRAHSMSVKPSAPTVRMPPKPSEKQSKSYSVANAVTAKLSTSLVVPPKKSTKKGKFYKDERELECNFRKCENEILRTIESLRTANVGRQTKKLQGQLNRLRSYIPIMEWPFIEHYRVGTEITKPTKEVFKKRGQDWEICDTIRKELKHRYHQSKKTYPHEYELKFLKGASCAGTGKSESAGTATVAKHPQTKSEPIASESFSIKVASNETGTNESEKSATVSLPEKVGSNNASAVSNGSLTKLASTEREEEKTHLAVCEAKLRDLSNNENNAKANCIKSSIQEEGSNACDGASGDEQAMREWLATHLLPPSVADKLLAEHGVRSVTDIFILVSNCPEALEGLPTLDRYKLKKAVQGGPSSLTSDE